MHKPILLNELELHFTDSCVTAPLSARIQYGQRIALVGRNGSGKSTLLKAINGSIEPDSGKIIVPDGATIAYVPQLIERPTQLSGGERFHHALNQALSLSPTVLLLDEPTNHLDQKNRQALMRMINRFEGTVIVATHDPTLLQRCMDTLWIFEHDQIVCFNGTHDDYQQQQQLEHHALKKQLTQLKQQKRKLHQALMQEQQRAAQRQAKGRKSIQNRKWPTVVNHTKAGRANSTTANNKAQIRHKKDSAINKLNALNLVEPIQPRFGLSARPHTPEVLLQITDGQVQYNDGPPLLSRIHLLLSQSERVAITGPNGSGKTTLIKALLSTPGLTITGEWHQIDPQYIGYLDQHYANIPENTTVIEALQQHAPDWTLTQCHQHLADFLFKGKANATLNTATLSGGEKARLSLAFIAAQPPALLILDEITNNLDLPTLSHVKDVINAYPGALLVISHCDDFLKNIHIDTIVDVTQFH